MVSRLSLPAAVLAALLALAGCGGSSESANGTDTTPTDTTPTAVTDTVRAVTTSKTTTASTPTPKRQTITIRVVGGLPQGGIARPKVKQGANVVLVVKSDTADEVHFHGYNISSGVAAGGTARIPFVAKIPGRFEIELENSGVQLAELTVQ